MAKTPFDPSAIVMRFSDGEFDSSERQQLNELLRTTPSAVESLVAEFLFEQVLRDELTLEANQAEAIAIANMLQNDRSSPQTRVRQPANSSLTHRRDRPRWVVVAASLAACVAVIVAVGAMRDGNPLAKLGASQQRWPKAESVDLKLVACRVPEWTDKTIPTTGGSSFQASKACALVAGSAVIELPSGTRVLVEGPSEFRATSGNSIDLSSGQLAARVPKQAAGFAVQTPGMSIIDIGTEFGVAVNKQGIADAYVYEGSVLVAPNGASEVTEHNGERLSAGEARRVLPDGTVDINVHDRAILSGIVAYDVNRFRQPSVVRGRVQSLVPSGDEMRLLDIKNDTQPSLLVERPGVRLTDQLEVNATDAGGAVRSREIRTSTLSAGIVVDAYLLRAALDSLPQSEFEVELKFDTPILGVIHEEDLLWRSDDVVGHPDVEYGRTYQSGLELVGGQDAKPDLIRISADRRTLAVNLVTQKAFSDELRILVQSNQDLN